MRTKEKLPTFNSTAQGSQKWVTLNQHEKISSTISLLKEKGLTINGVKMLLDKVEGSSIDEALNYGVYNPVHKSTKIIKDRLKNISKIIKDLKKLKNG